MTAFCVVLAVAMSFMLAPTTSTPLNAALHPGPIKEFHFHVYWFQTNAKQSKHAMKLRNMIIDNVKAKNFTAVCNGVTKEILPNLDEQHVPNFNTEPIGPHPCGSFEVWTPREYLSELMSFFMLNRGELSVLLHPLGSIHLGIHLGSIHLGMTQLEGHTKHVMWLGPSFRIDLSILSTVAGDPPQYPGLKLGYSAP